MTAGMITITNGVITKRAYPDEIPEGFYPGTHAKG